MKKGLTTIICVLMTVAVTAQENPFGIKFTGFVKNDVFYDSRQTVAAREGHFLLWPAEEKLDLNGDDINAKSRFNMLAIQTRLTGKITGPDAFGAKTSGVIEGAFFGHSDADVNGFRLRHAYGKLNWENTEVLFGQTWHPMFIAGCFPGVVSFNTGAPFQPFARNPQIRLTQTIGNIKISATAYSQRDFTSVGGSVPLQNAAMPAVHAGAAFEQKGNVSVLAGFGAGYQHIVPRLETDLGYVANESVAGYAAEAYLKVTTKPVTFKAEATYGQNTYDILGISSYSVLSIDAATDHREYIPQNSYAVWSEIHTNGKKVQFGLFAGYTQNLGTAEPAITSACGTRNKIDHVYRVAPRVVVNSGKVRLAFETEYTGAAFGSETSNTCEVIDPVPVANLRLLFAAYYFF